MIIRGNLGSLYIIIRFCSCKKKSLSLGFLRALVLLSSRIFIVCYPKDT
jgi:hypothetical protein